MRAGSHQPGLNHDFYGFVNQENKLSVNHKCSLFVRAGARIGYKACMNEILLIVDDLPIRVGDALIGFGALALVLLLVIAIVIARSGRRGAELAMAQAIRADELEERLSEMLQAQNQSTGRVDAMAQALVGRQTEMARDKLLSH